MDIIIAISGLSGVGKSTVTNILAQVVKNVKIFHQDDYFKKNKPLVTLASGTEVKNWDSPDAIDWESLNRDLVAACVKNDHYNIVLLEGFMLRDDLLDVKPDIHIHLSYLPHERIDKDLILDNRQLVIDQMLMARASTKIGAKHEKEIAWQLILPSYIETVEHSTFHYVVSVFGLKDGKLERLSKNSIANRIVDILARENISVDTNDH